MSSKSLIAAFTEDQVERLTGVSKQQLRYWDRTAFFVPSLAYADRRAPHSRLYTFRDLVSLKVISALRNEANVPLPHLRKVKEKLAHLGDEVWSKTTLYVLNKRVIFDSPGGKTKEEIISGQIILQIPLKVVSGNMEVAIRSLGQRDRTLIGKIEQKRNVVHNEPVVAGTRIPVRSIKSFAEAGYSIEQIRKEYPTLTDSDIRAAIIRLCCNEVLAAKRLDQALSLIEHEWLFTGAKSSRRLWVEIGPHQLRTNR